MMTGEMAEGRIDRRSLILGAGAGGLVLLAGCGAPRGYEKLPAPSRPGSTLDRMVPVLSSYLDVTNAHTGERVALRFMQGGRVNRRAVRRLDWVFRDWRANEDPDIDPRLYWGLNAISDQARQHGASGRITLLSGFRTPATTRHLQGQGTGVASNSYHMKRRAADIRVEGLDVEQVAAMAEWLQIGGVGRYPGSNFVHVDTGPIRTWHG
jgi:uncharacterized protein YcbK (DUF882 family)